MSGVPKSQRSLSSVEYVYNAQLFYHQTFECALRLPKRWTRRTFEETPELGDLGRRSPPHSLRNELDPLRVAGRKL